MPLFVLSFLVSIAILPGALDAVTVPRWAVLAIGVPLILVTSRPAPVASLRGAGLLTITAVLASLAWTPDLLNGLYDFAHVVIIGMAFCLGASQANLRPAWAGLIAGVSVSAVVGIAQLAGWTGVPQIVGPAGLFMNRNMMAEAGAVALVVALAEGWWFAALPPTVVLYIGQSRGAVLAVAAALVLAIWKRNRRAALALATLPVLMLFWTAGGLDGGTTSRLVTWRDAFEHLALFGHGLGSFAANYPVMEFAHNEPLQIVYELGVLAALPAAILAYVWMEKHHETEHLVLAAILVVGLFAFPLHMPVTAFAAALAAGHLAGARMRVRSSDGDRGRQGSTAPDGEGIPAGGFQGKARRSLGLVPTGAAASTATRLDEVTPPQRRSA